jgi:hypothetical protein
MNNNQKKLILRKVRSYIKSIVLGKRLIWDDVVFKPSLFYDYGLCELFPRLTPIWGAMVRKLGGGKYSSLTNCVIGKYDYSDYSWENSCSLSDKFEVFYRSGILALILALPYDDLIVWMDSIKLNWKSLEKKVNNNSKNWEYRTT